VFHLIYLRSSVQDHSLINYLNADCPASRCQMYSLASGQSFHRTHAFGTVTPANANLLVFGGGTSDAGTAGTSSP
jgi:hypothetical protein